MYTQEQIVTELLKRLTTDALLEVVAMSHRILTFEDFKKHWKLKYPNKSMFLDDLIVTRRI